VTLAATRRPRPAPSHAALRLRGTSAAPKTVAPCGRRWDPREFGERGYDSWHDGSARWCGGASDANRAQDLLALASASFHQDRRRERRGTAAAADSSSGNDSDDDDNYEEAAAFCGDPDAPANPQLDREAREAGAALLHGHCPLGIPRRVLRWPLLDAQAATALQATRPGHPATRVGNTLAVVPWPGSGSRGGGGDLMLAHTGGEGASEVHVTRMSPPSSSSSPSSSVLGSWRQPTRCRTQPILQVELAGMPEGWFGGGGGDAYIPPALLAARDACGVSLLRVGGGAPVGRKQFPYPEPDTHRQSI